MFLAGNVGGQPRDREKKTLQELDTTSLEWSQVLVDLRHSSLPRDVIREYSGIKEAFA